MRSISLQLSRKTYWHLDELHSIFLGIQLVVVGTVGLPIIIALALGYEVPDIIEYVERIVGNGIVAYISNLVIFTTVISMLGHFGVIFAKSLGGRCSDCKHQLDKHEDRIGRMKSTSCKGRKPAKNSIFKTDRCNCMAFVQRRGVNSKDFIDEDTGVTVTRKDKWLVLVVWLVIVFGWRMLMIEFDPYKWLGSLGAIALSFCTIYFSFKYIKKLERYRLKFNAVMKRWYSRRLQYVIFLYLSYNILMTILIQYGHDNYDRYLIAFKALEENPELERYPVENGKVAYVYHNTTYKELFIDDTMPAMYWHSFAFFMADANTRSNGFLGASNWIFIYEEAEFLIFFFMIRKGWLFR